MNNLKNGLLLVMVFLSGLGLSGQSWGDKIAPELLVALQYEAFTECIVTFHATADLRDLPSIRGKVNKGQVVWQRLSAASETSQRGVRQMLDRSGHRYRSFSIVNAIYLRVDRNLLFRLAARSEVAHLQPNPWVRIPEWGSAPESGARGGANWGVAQIRAPEVWARGITGAGVVVGSQDTGVEWDHPAIQPHYRGWSGRDTAVDHSYHWFDAIDAVLHPHFSDPNPCGLSASTPCDDHGHGTRTLGIVIGDDGAGVPVGVAPGARWIACRNMDRGFGSPASYLASFEWFLAPTDQNGRNPRPELAPHVINNSWSCPKEEGCTAANWSLMQTAIRQLKAAGVVVVAAAGNDGPDCRSIVDPPAIFAETFTVGSTNSLDQLVRHSGRGPVSQGAGLFIKPDVVAPGVKVLTTSPVAESAPEYSTITGTSAASPFVVGVVALLIEANPQLAGEVATIEKILRETTMPATVSETCANYSATAIPNPLTGYGRIDALAAVQRARALQTESSPDWSIRVFPNPVRDQLYFRADFDLQDAQVEIFDATGRAVDRFRVTTYPVRRNIANWPAGVYWWRISYRDQVATGKWIKG